MAHHPPMAPHDPPTPIQWLRRIAREYGWLAAAGGLALAVLLCSARFVAGTGLTWNAADPVALATESTAVTAPAPTTPPAPTGTRTAKPSPSQSKPTPTRTTTRPAPERTTTTKPPSTTKPAPSGPTLLGPDDDGERWRMTDRYCKRFGQEWYSQPGQRGDGNWYCVAWNRMPARVDMDAACRITYGNGAFARTTNDRDPQAWRCYR